MATSGGVARARAAGACGDARTQGCSSGCFLSTLVFTVLLGEGVFSPRKGTGWACGGQRAFLDARAGREQRCAGVSVGSAVPGPAVTANKGPEPSPVALRVAFIIQGMGCPRDVGATVSVEPPLWPGSHVDWPGQPCGHGYGAGGQPGPDSASAGWGRGPGFSRRGHGRAGEPATIDPCVPCHALGGSVESVLL